MKADFSASKYQVLTIERLDRLFAIDIANGRLYRKHNSGLHYWVMGEAGSICTGHPYVKICIDNNRYYLHDVLWFYEHHQWPRGVVDHINGDTYDNRIVNLRDVSIRENCNNQEKHRNGKLPGAQWHSGKHVWYALIRFDGIQYYLGDFKNEREAHEAYCYARDNGLDAYWKIKKTFKAKLFAYHKNHNKWIVCIYTTEGRKHIGYFSTIEEAIDARDAAIEKHRDIVVIANPLYTKEDLINDKLLR